MATLNGFKYEATWECCQLQIKSSHAYVVLSETQRLICSIQTYIPRRRGPHRLPLIATMSAKLVSLLSHISHLTPCISH